MESKGFNDEDFFIKLTIADTSYDDIEVKVTDPNKTIRDQIYSIITVFGLPRLDIYGRPLLYYLGRKTEDDEVEMLEFENENGQEQSLLDYGIRPGAHLNLGYVSCAYGGPIPEDMLQKNENKLAGHPFILWLKSLFKK